MASPQCCVGSLYNVMGMGSERLRTGLFAEMKRYKFQQSSPHPQQVREECDTNCSGIYALISDKDSASLTSGWHLRTAPSLDLAPAGLNISAY